MTKIQIIIDDEKSLKGITCMGISTQEILSDDEEWSLFECTRSTGVYRFTASNVIFDESPQLISIPDELLLRIRDYNIDAEHEYILEQTRKLKQKNDDLQQSIGHHLIELNTLEKEVKRYQEVLLGMIDRCPMAAAEICLQDGNLDAESYFVNKAKEENYDVQTQEKENRK